MIPHINSPLEIMNYNVCLAKCFIEVLQFKYNKGNFKTTSLLFCFVCVMWRQILSASCIAFEVFQAHLTYPKSNMDPHTYEPSE